MINLMPAVDRRRRYERPVLSSVWRWALLFLRVLGDVCPVAGNGTGAQYEAAVCIAGGEK